MNDKGSVKSMPPISAIDTNKFNFKEIHPKIHIGTASDRYAGWVGQIYSEGRYNTTVRSHKVGNRTFKEEILPVESVIEYFNHFSVLELDFTFYRPLLNKNLEPTSSYKNLASYNKYLSDVDRLILKVPQVIFSHKLWQSGKQVENPNYLNAELFIKQFYDPANAVLGDNLLGFIFEQEYHRKNDRIAIDKYIKDLADFFISLPEDDRYHVETRTDYYHTMNYYDMLSQHGIGHVLSHWTWLPTLMKQFTKAGMKFYNSGSQCIIRLLTPLRMRYNDSYIKTYPFDKPVQELMSSEMIPETVEIVKAGINAGVDMNVILNNRAGGNAPIMAGELVNKLQ